MADYGQPGAATRRVRFYDGQFLVDQDFVDEQKYHLDRERRLGKVLQITGIAEGLAAAAAGANKVRVSAGTAIDSAGRLLVLAEDRTLDLPAAVFNDKQGVKLQIIFREQATELADTGGMSERRWLEDPQIIAVATDGQSTEKPWNDTMPAVTLALLRLDNKGTVTVDATAAQYAGLRLPGAAGIGGANPGALKLSVNGRSRLGGITDYGADAVISVAPGTVQFDAPGVVGGRLVVDGTTGNVGIGNASPGPYKLNVNGRVRVEGADYKADAVLSVAPGTIHFDAPNQRGGRLVIDGTTGNIGIGLGAAATPRTAIDTGKNVMSGPVNDYTKAQFTLSGGGIVTWGGPNNRLKWTKRFLAISMERGPVFGDGHLSINPPTTAIPAANVYDGAARTADRDGVLLRDWEALYAVHTVGGDSVAVSGFQITRYTHAHNAPSNWILVAVVNADDGTVKLGTGVTLSAKTSSSRGNPLPIGTILMWSGAADTIPAGFSLCNGTNGTPDLRSRFVVGGGGGDSQPNTWGEPDQHNHRIALPNLDLHTGAGGDHVHAPPSVWYDRSFLEYAAAADRRSYNGIDRGGGSVSTARTGGSGTHTHPVSLSIGTADTTSSAGLHRPRWYALCFIMKVE